MMNVCSLNESLCLDHLLGLKIKTDSRELIYEVLEKCWNDYILVPLKRIGVSFCHALNLQKTDQNKNGVFLPYLHWRLPNQRVQKCDVVFSLLIYFPLQTLLRSEPLLAIVNTSPSHSHPNHIPLVRRKSFFARTVILWKKLSKWYFKDYYHINIFESRVNRYLAYIAS